MYVYATTELHQLRPVQLYYAPCHNFITIHHAVNIYTNVVRCWLVWLQLRGGGGEEEGYNMLLYCAIVYLSVCLHLHV